MTVSGEWTGSAWRGEPHPAAATGGADPEGVRDRLVAAAASIGERLAAEAVWTGPGCTWPLIRPREDDAPAAADPPLANGLLYEGTAGIALFLAELHHLHPDPRIARTARGALDCALAHAASLSDTSFGFYSGRVGVAYAAVRAGLRLGIPFRDAAEGVLRPLAGNEPRDIGLDALSGAAGAIPALLRISPHLDADLTLGMARRLGEHLRATAHRGPDGWSWNASPAVVRALCGFSHGASGMAHAFLELYHHTGDGEHRYAAEQALLYERGFLHPERGNWPDFRSRGAGAILTATPDELRERLRAEPLPAEPSYSCHWCHGAAGIGLVRLRAYQVLGAPRYAEEARAAIATARASLGELPINYSLCHGVAGNCETLVMGARVLGEPALREHALQWALRGAALHEESGRRWPSGALDGVPEPGLLLGEAGIGLFLLRLAHPEIESVLLVTAPEPASRPGATGAAGYEAARERTVIEHFGGTLERFRGLGIDPDPLLPPRPPGDAPAVSDAAAAFEAIRTRIAEERDAGLRALMEDAFAVERARYELLVSATNFTWEHIQSIARPEIEEIELDAARFELSPRARVAETAYDWEDWTRDARPTEGGAAWLLYRTGVRVALRELAPLAAAVLRALRRPASLDRLTASVAAELADDSGDEGRAWLRQRVREQLVSAYRAGFVRVAGEPAEPVRDPPDR